MSGHNARTPKPFPYWINGLMASTMAFFLGFGVAVKDSDNAAPIWMVIVWSIGWAFNMVALAGYSYRDRIHED
jgi:hypothetical protein